MDLQVFAGDGSRHTEGIHGRLQPGILLRDFLGVMHIRRDPDDRGRDDQQDAPEDRHQGWTLRESRQRREPSARGIVWRHAT